MSEIDKVRFEALSVEILKPIKEHLAAGPDAQTGVYEALNALALATAIVITFTETRRADKPHLFFIKALDEQLKTFERSASQN